MDRQMDEWLAGWIGWQHFIWPYLRGVEDHKDVLQPHNRVKGQTGEADHPGQPQQGKQHSASAGRFPVHRQAEGEIHTTRLVTS